MRSHRARSLAFFVAVLLGRFLYEAPPAFSAAGSAWGAPPGVEPCGADTRLEEELARDPGLAARRELFEAMMREAERTGLRPSAANPIYIIPVAVHVVHQNGPENIPVNQILSQIDAVNRDVQNLLSKGSPAVDCQIKFCLAQLLPSSGSSVTWDSIPGVTYTVSSQTNHLFPNATSEMLLKQIDYLPSDRYLNIWVVKQIGNAGVVGYGTFPGGTQTLDGIVMDYRVFGSNSYVNNYGYFNTLLPSNDDGKVLAHEVGHWLNLWHPFQGGCTGITNGCALSGDFVCDTPPEALYNSGCPTNPPTTCGASQPNPIENFMDYTNDACRYAFTAGQRTRMHAAIGTWRSLLVSAGNLIATGCPSGLNALIDVVAKQVCVGDSVTVSTSAAGSGFTYLWNFGTNSPSQATTQIATAQITSPGPHTITLTVTDTNNNTWSTNTVVVYGVACTPITGACRNWVWGKGCEVSFATGLPVFVSGTRNFGTEGSPSAISNASGNLLFYANDDTVWTSANTAMPNGGGMASFPISSGHNGTVIMRRPGSSTQYYLFSIAQWEDGPQSFPLRVSTIDMTANGGLGDVIAKLVPVTLPGNPRRLMEAQTLIPHCSGPDSLWWHIAHVADTTTANIFVTPVTASGPGVSTAYSIGHTGLSNLSAFGSITASRDGTRIAISSSKTNAIRVYTFNRATGVPAPFVNTGPVGAYHGVAFSPSADLVYYTYNDTTASNMYGLRQLQLVPQQIRTLAPPGGTERDVELGPDGKVYVSHSQSGYLGCINFPDLFNAANQNECGYNPSSVPLGPAANTLLGGLPNSLQLCAPGIAAPQFTYKITNCTTVTFTSPNCAPWTWNFGDNSSGSGQTVSHTYTLAAVCPETTFSVTLTVPSAFPTTLTLPVTVGMQPVTVVGPNPACLNPSNYSVSGPSTYQYSWTITGGTPASATGKSVDVAWGLGGGMISLLVTDPATGCSKTVFFGVEACPHCVKPPLGLVAWWPFDESSGLLAKELVAGNDGLDINGPVMAPGAVLNARQMNGSTTYVRVNDAPQIDLGTGNLTIDAWIQNLPGGSNYQGIVDKRSLSPDQGYALYVKNNYLALLLGDGATGTEYWSASTPVLNDGNWHHVAATVDRADGLAGTRLYVDGTAVASFPGYPAAGNLDNGEKLLLGAFAPWANPVLNFKGKIDEVEIFTRALAEAEIDSIYGAGAAGKCKEYCHVPWDQTICADQGSLKVQLLVCNYNATPQTYSFNFNGLPMNYQGAAGGCSWNGPTQFQLVPAATSVTVGAIACTTLTVQIQRPQNMPPGTTACYSVTMTNVATGASRTCVGSMWASTQACTKPLGTPFVAVGPLETASLQFQVANTSGVPRGVTLYVEAMPVEADPLEPPLLSLNGLPPGAPYFTQIFLDASDSATVHVDAMFTQPASFRFYDIILYADADGDGTYETASSIGVRYDERPEGTTGVPPEPVGRPLALLPIEPNPVRGTGHLTFDMPRRGHVVLALFDVSGRRVRALWDGIREVGRSVVPVDTQGLPAGLYYLRLTLEGEVRTGQIVVLH